MTEQVLHVSDGFLVGNFDGAPVKVLEIVPMEVRYDAPFWNMTRGGEVDNYFVYGFVRYKHLGYSGLDVKFSVDPGDEDDILVIMTPVGGEETCFVLFCYYAVEMN